MNKETYHAQKYFRPHGHSRGGRGHGRSSQGQFHPYGRDRGSSYRGRGRGQGAPYRGRGTRGPRGTHRTSDTTPKPQITTSSVCHKCGMDSHWAKTCRTPKYIVDLPQESIKGKNTEIHLT